MASKGFPFLNQAIHMTYFFLVFALLLNGCAGNTPMQFYMLNADDPSSDASNLPFDKHLVVGLGPIHLPDYLNRPQIVVEVSKNQYNLDEHHRWAERLDQNIGRALARSLAGRLGVEQIVRHPWSQKQHIDYQVGIDILAFHQSADGQSRLQAQWQIKNQEQLLRSKQFDCSLASTDDPDAIVTAQSACLGRLSMEIVAELRQLANAGIGNRE
jgi:uncharacterized lipoprotein YmbA